MAAECGESRVSSASRGCRQESAATPTVAMLDLIDNALLASKRLAGKMRNIFSLKARGAHGRGYFAFITKAGFAKHAGYHEANL